MFNIIPTKNVQKRNFLGNIGVTPIEDFEINDAWVSKKGENQDESIIKYSETEPVSVVVYHKKLTPKDQTIVA